MWGLTKECRGRRARGPGGSRYEIATSAGHVVFLNGPSIASRHHELLQILVPAYSKAPSAGAAPAPSSGPGGIIKTAASTVFGFILGTLGVGSASAEEEPSRDPAPSLPSERMRFDWDALYLPGDTVPLLSRYHTTEGAVHAVCQKAVDWTARTRGTAFVSLVPDPFGYHTMFLGDLKDIQVTGAVIYASPPAIASLANGNLQPFVEYACLFRSTTEKTQRSIEYLTRDVLLDSLQTVENQMKERVEWADAQVMVGFMKQFMLRVLGLDAKDRDGVWVEPRIAYDVVIAHPSTDEQLAANTLLQFLENRAKNPAKSALQELPPAEQFYQAVQGTAKAQLKSCKLCMLQGGSPCSPCLESLQAVLLDPKEAVLRPPAHASSRVHAVTYLSQEWRQRYSVAYEASAVAHRWNYTILGTDRPWQSLYHKMREYRRFLEAAGGHGSDLYLLSDCDDVMFLGPAKEMEHRFDAIRGDTELVISTERPHIARNRVPLPEGEKQSPYYYLNSGLMLGTKRALLRLIEHVFEEEWTDDQVRIGAVLATPKMRDRYTADFRQQILCSLRSDYLDDVQFNDGKLFNKATGTFPLVVHCPGTGLLQPHWSEGRCYSYLARKLHLPHPCTLISLPLQGQPGQIPHALEMLPPQSLPDTERQQPR